MRLPFLTVLTVLSLTPLSLLADVTIRYKIDFTSSMPIPANMSDTVIRMKGNKGITIAGGQTAIVDFVKQEVTLIDPAAKKYVTIPVSEYSGRIGSAMPQPGGAADMLKSMKTTCETSKPEGSEIVQGIQTEERDVTCTATMTLPEGAQPQAGSAIPSMSMKFVVKTWTASQAERVRIPGLWQLSGFELWNSVFMNPTAGIEKIAPGLAPMMEELAKSGSVTLRSTMEMYMDMRMPSAGAAAPSSTPLMKMKNEVVEISTAPLDDSLFTVPSDFTAGSFGELMNGRVAQAMAGATARRPRVKESGPVPAGVMAYVPRLTPLSRTNPEIPAAANGMQGIVEVLVTVGPGGDVQKAEALGGHPELRQAATDAVSRWTFRPVIRNGAPVTAYTDATVYFMDRTIGPPMGTEFTPEAAAEDRLEELTLAMPRTPQQIFADLEQDAGGGNQRRRHGLLGPLAMAAVKAGEWDKAGAFAKELLAGGRIDGDAIHDGHVVLGLVALQKDDKGTARQQLLEAGRTPGSPVLNSFGPNMALAKGLLQKGEREVVLDYFELCRAFWKMGGSQLDSWRDSVRKGETPFFGGNLR